MTSINGIDPGLAQVIGAPGILTFPASAAPANAVSLAAALREEFDQAEKVISTITPALMTQATVTVFTVAGGAIHVLELIARCTAVNNANAATLQYNWAGTLGTAVTITGASVSLASLVAGDMVICDFTTLATAPAIMATGVSGILGRPTTGVGFVTNGPGNLQYIVGAAATTGLWGHHLRYRPLSRGVTVTAAF